MNNIVSQISSKKPDCVKICHCITEHLKYTRKNRKDTIRIWYCWQSTKNINERKKSKIGLSLKFTLCPPQKKNLWFVPSPGEVSVKVGVMEFGL